MLIDALPPGTVRFSHTVTGTEQSEDGVVVLANILAPHAAEGERGSLRAGEGRVEQFSGDLAVAADGQMSETRRRNVPSGDVRRSDRDYAVSCGTVA